jgi:hypothetical protein
MLLAEIVAGAPFFFDVGEGGAVGVSPAPGVGVGFDQDAGDSSGLGVGEADDLYFFFGEGLGEESGAGVGEDLFFFFEGPAEVGSGVSAGAGLVEALFFFEEGDAEFCGVTNGFGVGDFSAPSVFFFGGIELWRCFRGGGVGVGAKIFSIFLPNDSSACVCPATPRSIAVKKRILAILLTRRMGAESSTSASDE